MTANTHSHPVPFTRSDYKTLGLAALGGALEIYDFIIFVFFALTLSQLFFRRKCLSGCDCCKASGSSLPVIWRGRWAEF